MSDLDNAAAVYRTLSDAQLQMLRLALTLDASETTRPDTLAFCNGRLALIDAELERRKQTPPSHP